MSISAMKQALEAITNVLAGGDFDNPYADLKEAGAALKEAIAEAEKQEPVGEIVQAFDDLVAVSIPVMPPVGTKLYTAPVHASDIPQKRVDETAKDRHEWVDLTQQEVEQIYSETQDEFQFSQLLAYKLREKNSGWNGKGWA